MTRVYLNEPGSTARTRGGRLEVDKGDTVLLRLPLEQIEHVVVLGKGVQLTTALVMELLKRGVGVSYATRGGSFVGGAFGAQTGGVPLRIGQYAHLLDPVRATRFAQMLVIQKLAGQYTHLCAYPGAASAAARLGRLAEQAAQARDVDQVRGYEGAAAAAYWQALVPLVPAGWSFVGRRHHPPPDPLNAMLSFAYTLMLQELTTAVHVVGLDIQLGALHPPDASRPSLALDLQEPLRPLGVDRWVFASMLAGTFSPGQFQRDDERVLLSPEARRRFLTLYERQLSAPVRHPLAPGRISLRQAIELHVRLTGRLFTGEAASLEAPRWL